MLINSRYFHTIQHENSIVSVTGDGATKVTLCRDVLNSPEARDVLHRGVLLLTSRHDEKIQYAKITDMEQVSIHI